MQLMTLKLKKCFYCVSKCQNWFEHGNYLQKTQSEGAVNPMVYNVSLNNFTAGLSEHVMQALITLLELEAWSRKIFYISQNFLWVMLQVEPFQKQFLLRQSAFYSFYPIFKFQKLILFCRQNHRTNHITGTNRNIWSPHCFINSAC